MSDSMKLFFIYLFSLLLVFDAFPAETPDGGEIKKLTKLEILELMKENSPNDKPWIDFSSRYTKATLLSMVIPGAGQTYLGSEIKGIGFTLAFFGVGLAALSNQSNYVGREDRLKVLIETYNNAGDFTNANRAWQDIVFERSNRDRDLDRRNLYSYITIGIWVLNMVDVIFFSEDKGVDDFSSNSLPPLQVGFTSDGQFNGLAFKFNLP